MLAVATSFQNYPPDRATWPRSPHSPLWPSGGISPMLVSGVPSISAFSPIPKIQALLQLPDEVVLEIARCLDGGDLLAFSFTSRKVYHLSLRTILFWKHAVIPAMLDYVSQIHEYSPQALKQAVARGMRNTLLPGPLQFTPYQRHTMRLTGGIHGSVHIIPGTQLMVALLESSEENKEVLVVDLQSREVLGRKRIEGGARNCNLAVDASSFNNFRVALLWQKDENETFQVKVFGITIKRPNQGDKRTIAASFEDLSDWLLSVPRAEQDTMMRRFLLRGELVFIEECFKDGSRELAAVKWRDPSPKCVWFTVPSAYTSWQPVGDYLICSGYREIRVIPLSYLQAPNPKDFLKSAGAARHLSLNFGWPLDALPIVTFDEDSWTSSRSLGETTIKIPGVAFERGEDISISHIFNLLIHVYDDQDLKVEVVPSEELAESASIERLLYTKGVLWGTDECSLYVSPPKGKDPVGEMKPLAELCGFETMDVSAGLVCIGSYEPGPSESEIVSCLSVLSYVPV